MKTLVPQRDQTLQDELRKQQNNEALRRQFADKANQVGPWIEKQMDAVSAIGMGMQGSLEEQLGRLREYEEAVYQFKPHLEELERINQQIQESFVFENRYTQYTMETLRVGWEQLVTSVNRTINEVENQILTRDSKGITQEQLNVRNVGLVMYQDFVNMANVQKGMSGGPREFRFLSDREARVVHYHQTLDSYLAEPPRSS